jgi:hypothetical protein
MVAGIQTAIILSALLLVLASVIAVAAIQVDHTANHASDRKS